MAAQDTSELFSLAREVLSVGIRLASQVNRHIKLIDQSSESWGITYTGISSVTVGGILERFHKDQVSTSHRFPDIHVLTGDCDRVFRNLEKSLLA